MSNTTVCELPFHVNDILFSIFSKLNEDKHYGGIKIPVLCSMVMSCYYIKKHLQRQTLSWLDSLFYCFIHQFGGNVLSSIVMSEPITFLTMDSFLLTLLLSWVLIFSFPYDFIYHLLSNSFLRRTIRLVEFIALVQYMCDYSMDKAIDKSDDLHCGYILILLCGTLAGAGGSYLVEQTQVLRNEEHQVPFYSVLSHPSFVIRRSFFASLLYIYLRNPFKNSYFPHSCSPNQCKFILYLFISTTYILYIFKFDIFSLISKIFHFVTFIPNDLTLWITRWVTAPRVAMSPVDSGYTSDDMETKKMNSLFFVDYKTTHKKAKTKITS